MELQQKKQAYSNAFYSLQTYLVSVLHVFDNMGETTGVNRAAFNSAWNSYYEARQTLINKISLVAKSAGDTAASQLNTFVTVTYPTDTGAIQTQIDGKINSYFQEADPNWDRR